MGFPTWTLWGMGLAGLGALIAVGLAFLLLSPRFVTRVGLSNRRLETRIRSLVAYALSLMLLALGFFVAGVPLGASTANTGPEAAPSGTEETVEGGVAATAPLLADSGAPSPTSAVAAVTTRTTGAFANPLVDGLEATPPLTAAAQSAPVTDTVSSAATPASVTPSATAGFVVAANATPTTSVSPATSASPATSPSPTSSPSPTLTLTPEPTQTPTPTMTPTPIEGETAIINTSGSTLWVRRTPGGQPLALARDRDIVILSSGHAHQGGVLWREVMTVEGVLGWVQEEFLTLNGET